MADILSVLRELEKVAKHEAMREVYKSSIREIERLRKALEPFQRNVEASSLSAALGHIGREELWNARHTLLGKIR